VRLKTVGCGLQGANALIETSPRMDALLGANSIFAELAHVCDYQNSVCKGEVGRPLQRNPSVTKAQHTHFATNVVDPMLSTRILAQRAGPVLARQFTRRLQTATETRPPALGVASTVSITAAITNDHRDLETTYNEVVSSKDPDHQQRYGNLFTWELAKHSVGEELVLYPAFEKHLGTVGKQIADTDRKDHHEASNSSLSYPLLGKPLTSSRSKSSSKNSKT